MPSVTDKPTCFIAMAFGWDDTDVFYENLILPVLKRNDIRPIIINRHQSNDDLNFQIIEQIEKADFCIADLTYARPSVYFEAGFAQRSIPVIYTVRKDHLDKGQPDNLRVHFDLQMKPLIVWTNQNDSTFANKLERRIQATILKGWKIKQRSRVDYETAIKIFETNSVVERLSILRKQAILSFSKLGFSESSWRKCINCIPYVSRGSVLYHSKDILNGRVNNVSASQFDGNITQYIAVQAYATITKTELKGLRELYSNLHYDISNNVTEILHQQKNPFIKAHIFSIGLKPVPISRVESVFVDFVPNKNASVYNVNVTKSLYYKSMRKEIPMSITFHFLGNIKSPLDLNGHLLDFTAKFNDANELQ